MLIKVLLTNVWERGGLQIVGVIAVSIFGLYGFSPNIQCMCMWKEARDIPGCQLVRGDILNLI